MSKDEQVEVAVPVAAEVEEVVETDELDEVLDRVDALVNRRDPGGAGIGAHDAGGTEYRQAAEDTEARVHGLLRERHAIDDADADLETARVSEPLRLALEVFAHHASRESNAFINLVVDALETFRGDAPPEDDLTMITFALTV